MDRRKAEVIKALLTELEALEGFREALEDCVAGVPDTTTITITNTLDGNTVTETITVSNELKVNVLMRTLNSTITKLEKQLTKQ